MYGLPLCSAGKESASNVGDLGLIPGLGRSLGEGKGYPLQYSGLEISMDYEESDTTDIKDRTGIKTARRSINNLRYADDTNLTAESKELKSLLRKVKEESEKVGLKLYIQKTNHGIWFHHFMANSWENNGNRERLYFLGLQNHCRW